MTPFASGAEFVTGLVLVFVIAPALGWWLVDHPRPDRPTPTDDEEGR